MSTAEQIARLRARMVAGSDTARAARILTTLGLGQRQAAHAALSLRSEVRRARAGVAS